MAFTEHSQYCIPNSGKVSLKAALKPPPSPTHTENATANGSRMRGKEVEGESSMSPQGHLLGRYNRVYSHTCHLRPHWSVECVVWRWPLHREEISYLSPPPSSGSRFLLSHPDTACAEVCQYARKILPFIFLGDWATYTFLHLRGIYWNVNRAQYPKKFKSFSFVSFFSFFLSFFPQFYTFQNMPFNSNNGYSQLEDISIELTSALPELSGLHCTSYNICVYTYIMALHIFQPRGLLINYCSMYLSQLSLHWKLVIYVPIPP